MAKFDRSKFKKSKSLQQQQDELVESGKLKKKGSSGLPEFLEFKEDGEYLIRFYPAHLDEQGDPLSYFMMLRRYTFLKFMKDQYKDGEKVVDADGNAVQELGVGIVMDSTVHGDTELDLINEYKEFVRAQGMEMYKDDKEGYKEYMKNIWGYGHGKNFFGGLKASEEFVAYGSLLERKDGQLVEKDLYRVILKGSMRKEMLKMSASEDGDEGITTDPFTDPDDGFVVKIVRDSKKAKEANDPSLYYDVSFYTKNYIPVKFPLPDSFVDKMEEIPSLASQFENKYTTKEFDKALEGLTRFDEEYGYNVFSQDAWLDICEKVASQYPDEEEQEEAQEESTPAEEAKPKKPSPAKKAPVKKPAPAPEPQEEEQDEEADDMPFEADEETPAPSASGTLSPAEKLAQMKAKAQGRAK